MKSKMSSSLLTVLSLFFGILAFVSFGFQLVKTEAATVAKSGICGENLTWSLDDNGMLTISGVGEMETSYQKQPWYSSRSSVKAVKILDGVTSIGYCAFDDCTNLTSVEIPNSVKIIQQDAFETCSKLTSIEIPKSITMISHDAFEGCTSLTSVSYTGTIDQWVQINFVSSMSNPLYYAEDLYINAQLLTEANITSATKIGDNVFRNYDNLTSVEIGDSVVSIGDEAFSNCDNLTSIAIPESVKSIGRSAFYYCNKLKNITLPDTLINIDGYAFSYTGYYNNSANWENQALYLGKYLINVKTTIGVCQIKEGTLIIAGETFNNCSSLTNVTIPDSVRTIGRSAFNLCKALTGVTIGNNVTNIGDYAFCNCINLTSIEIPESVSSIGESAFYGCTALTEIKYNAIECVDLTDGDSGAFSKAGQSKPGITVIIGKNVTKIPAYLFNPGYDSSYFPKIATVFFEEGTICTNIGDSAFRGCSSLMSVEMPETIANIGDSAFYGCSSLMSVEMPETIANIGNYAFYNCSSLESVKYDGTIDQWVEIEFDNYTANPLYYAGNLYINDKLVTEARLTTATEMSSYAFYGCTSLTNIEIPETVTSIGSAAFHGCSSLTSVNYNGTIDEWGQIEFDNYTANPLYYAGNLYINDKLVTETRLTTATEISSYAFYGCTSLTSIEIPETVTSIGSAAFQGCSSLASVSYTGTIDQWVEIDFSSYNANPLYVAKKLYINDELVTEATLTVATEISIYSFYNYSSLTSLTIGNNVTNIGNYAFYKCSSLTSLTIGNNVTNIGNYAFYNCSSLTSLIIGKGVTNIGNGAFSYCNNLIDVVYHGTFLEKNRIIIGDNNDALKNALWDWACSENSREHKYDSECDNECNSCFNIRISGIAHTYDSVCAGECNQCGENRNAPHNYEWIIDKESECGVDGVKHEECSLCHKTRNENTKIPAPNYFIIYHLDGGINALKNPDIYTSEDVIALKDATKIGYDFAGWFLDVEKNEQITEILNKTGNLDLYAKFIPQTYEATFDFNGGTTTDKITIILNDTIGTTKKFIVDNGSDFNPYQKWKLAKRSGYVFAGWEYNGMLVGDKISTNKDIELKARWNDANYSYFQTILGVEKSSISNSGIRFGGTQGDYNISQTYSSSTFYVYVSGEYRTIKYYGEAFCNWYYTDINKTKRYYSYGGFTIRNVTLGKELISISGSDLWDDYNSSNSERYSGTLEVTPGTLLCITVNGYSNDPNKEYEKKSLGYISLSVGETRKSIKVSYSNEKLISQVYDAAIQMPSASKDRYEFAGWYDENDILITENWQYLENKKFKAKWQPISYQISYELDGGENSESNPSRYTLEDSITLSNPYKPGYTFNGWYTDAGFTIPITKISNQDGDITLYAKYTVNEYGLTLQGNGGVLAPKVTFVSEGEVIRSDYLTSEDTISLFKPEDKEGYIFAGWYSEENLNSLFKFTGTINEDITLFAKWLPCVEEIVNIENINEFNAQIDGKTGLMYAFVPMADGKIAVTSKSSNLDLLGSLYDAERQLLVSSDDISDNNLNFSYSYNVEAGKLYYIEIKGNTASTRGEANISVEWTGNSSIVGKSYSSKTMKIVYGNDFVLPEPVRKGYVFLGWFDESGRQVTAGVWDFITNKTLTARWATIYTVIFKDINGEIISSNTYYYGDKIDAPELPIVESTEKTCYNIVKWNNNYNGICVGDAVYMVVIESISHVNSQIMIENEIQGDCDTMGQYDNVIYCTECGKELSRETVFIDVSHNYKWVIDKGNNCGIAGIKHEECTICHDKRNENTVIYPTGNHVYDGVCDGACNVCGQSRIAPHDYEWIIDKENSCEAAGIKHEECSLCHSKRNENTVIYPTGNHVYDEVCDDTCNVCGQSRVAPHDYEWIIDKENNCGVDGIKHEECSICHAKRKENTIINATGNHIYDNEWDSVCNKCAESREVLHEYLSDSDAICDICGETRVVALENYFEYTVSNGVVTIIGIKPNKTLSGDIIIPNTIDGYPIGSFSMFAFRKCSKITSIVIPESVASIGIYAFEGCSGLTSVTIPNSVKTIEAFTFEGCSRLVSVEIPNSVTSIGDYAFEGCSGLTSVTIPNSVTSIGNRAFDNCTSLTRIEMPNSVTSIGNGAFYNTGYYGNEANWEGNVLYIGKYLIAARETIKECQIKEGTLAIAAEAFSNCISLSSVAIPDSVTSMSFGTFMNCANLTSIMIPKSVTSLDACAFKGCSKLIIYCEASGQPNGWDEDWNCSSCPVYWYSEIMPVEPGNYWHYTEDGEIELWANHIHDYNLVETAPTCTEDGYTTYTCERCFACYVGDYIEALGHAFEDYVSNSDATCVQDGTKTGKCIRCAETDTITDDDSKIGHTKGEEVIENNVAPDCVNKGFYDVVVYCLVCEAELGREKIIVDALNHNYGKWVSNGDATHTRICLNDETHTETENCQGGEATATSGPICLICNAEYGERLWYTVIFKNYDGTVLSTSTYHYGDTVVVPATPVKPADNTYSYAFKGWKNFSTVCVGNVEYVPEFTSAYIDYTVVFKNYDNSVLSSKTYHYGDTIMEPAIPSKPSDNIYSYLFTGWDNDIVNCNGNAEYKATYTQAYIDYTIEFKNSDGTTLSSITYHYGDMVVEPSNPTKAADNTYTYTFKGWDFDVVNCNGNATYTATYLQEYRNYVVRFINDDGTEISSANYHYGDVVEEPVAPTKASDGSYTYIFAGWDGEVVNCNGDKTYTAIYNSKPIEKGGRGCASVAIGGSDEGSFGSGLAAMLIVMVGASAVLMIKRKKSHS